jgi:hypothetical protein
MLNAKNGCTLSPRMSCRICQFQYPYWPDHLVIPLIDNIENFKAGRHTDAERAASSWLLATIEDHSGLLPSQLEIFFGLDDAEQNGNNWRRIRNAKNGRLVALERDRIARIAIKQGWMHPIEHLANHPITELAYRTTRGFDYSKPIEPSNRLTKAEEIHRESMVLKIEAELQKKQSAIKYQRTLRHDAQRLFEIVEHEFEVIQGYSKSIFEAPKNSLSSPVLEHDFPDFSDFSAQIRVHAERLIHLAKRLDQYSVKHDWHQPLP